MPGSDGLGNFGDFWKKQLAEIRSWARPVEIWSWTRRVQFVGYGMRRAFVGLDGTVSIVKIVSLSLSSCRKTKSQECNKSFVPELKKVVSVSGFLCIWTVYMSVYFTHSYLGLILVNILQRDLSMSKANKLLTLITNSNINNKW